MKKVLLLSAGAMLSLGPIAGSSVSFWTNILNLTSVAKPLFSQCIYHAISIENRMNFGISYFYSSWKDNGQKKWYNHNLNAGESTWDWGWSANTQYPIEINFRNNNLYKGWIVICFAGWTDTGKVEYMNNHVYLNLSNYRLPPYWSNIWYEKFVHSSNSDFYAYHSKIAICEHQIYWNDQLIYSF